MGSDEQIVRMCSVLGTDPEALRTWALHRATEIVAELDPDSHIASLLQGASDVGSGRIVPTDPIEPTEPTESTETLELLDDQDVEELADDELLEIDIGLDEDESAPEEAAPRQEPATFRRRHERFTLDEPVLVRFESWNSLVQHQARDISRGGMFVHADESPPLHARVTLTATLPQGVSIELEADVVHVVDPEQAAASDRSAGFGVQFVGLTRERRDALRTLVRHAMSSSAFSESIRDTLTELGYQPSASGAFHLSMKAEESELYDQLRTQVQKVRVQGDFELLGIEPGCTRAELDEAYFALAEAWHPDVAARHGAPEIRRLVTELFLQVERAYERVGQSGMLAPEPETPLQTELEATPEAPPEVLPEEISQQPAGEPPSASRGSALLARKLASRLGSIRAKYGVPKAPPRKGPPPPPPADRPPQVGRALALVSEKRFDEAAELLEQLPNPSPKLKILLCFVRARAAVKAKDYDQALRLYRAILDVEPEHPTAQRELIMLEALMSAL